MRWSCGSSGGREAWAALAALLVALSGAAASADDIGPEDERLRAECTAAFQSSGGADCVSCSRSVGEPPVCERPIEGMELRCAVGATHRSEVWCRGPRPIPPAAMAWVPLGFGVLCMLAGGAAVAGLVLWRARKRRPAA